MELLIFWGVSLVLIIAGAIWAVKADKKEEAEHSTAHEHNN
jgi:cytochrome c-type biogenesis protein CcmH/NrfF